MIPAQLPGPLRDEAINVAKWVGVPYLSGGRTIDGADCWGFVALLYKAEFDIDLPDYSDLYGSAEDLRSVARAIRERTEFCWDQLGDAKPAPGDVALFAPDLPQLATHVGVYAGLCLGDRYVLHVRRGTRSVCERLASPTLSAAFRGFYRYRGPKG